MSILDFLKYLKRIENNKRSRQELRNLWDELFLEKAIKVNILSLQWYLVKRTLWKDLQWLSEMVAVLNLLDCNSRVLVSTETCRLVIGLHTGPGWWAREAVTSELSRKIGVNYVTRRVRIFLVKECKLSEDLVVLVQRIHNQG